MGFKDRFFTFQGRISRLTYLLYTVALFFISCIAFIAAFTPILYKMFSDQHPELFLLVSCLILYTIFGIAIVVSSFSLICRRLHDIDFSGYWIFAIVFWTMLCAYFGYVWAVNNGSDSWITPFSFLKLVPSIVLVFVPGTAGENRFGPAPV